MPLLRKDLKIGFLAGAVLLVLAVVYALVLTFSGSPEPAQVAQGPTENGLAADPLFEEPGDKSPVPIDETPAQEQDSLVGPEVLARTTQTPAGDWSAYGFNGNPPVVTETPTLGNRSALPTDTGGNDIPNANALSKDADPGLTTADGMASTRTHVIAPGETLSAIAEKYYGDPNLYPVIEKANPSLNPQRLKVGQKLLIPDRESAGTTATQPQTPVQSPTGPAPATADGLYEVQPGDTLARIAARRFGREALWEEIYKLNQEQIGADPSKLKVGMKLKLPS